MRILAIASLVAIVASACAPSQGGATTAAPTATSAPTGATVAPIAAVTATAAPTATKPAFLAIQLADVRTGERFTLGQFEGKVVLAQAMAVW